MYDSTSQRTPGYRFQYQVPPKSAPPSMIAKVLDARLAQPAGGDEPREPAADDGDIHLVGQRLAAEILRRVRVCPVRRELAERSAGTGPGPPGAGACPAPRGTCGAVSLDRSPTQTYGCQSPRLLAPSWRKGYPVHPRVPGPNDAPYKL